MDARYIRNVPALTEEECLRLREKRVLVVGCGGLGGYIIDLLARIGIGTLRLVDGDVFEASNLNRQLLCDESVLGVSKAQVAAEYVARVNSDIAVESVTHLMTLDNVHTLVADFDIVMDGLDNISSRKLLSAACKDAGIPYVYGAIQGWSAQAAVSMPGDDVVEKLFPEEIVIRDKSVLSFTPAMCASIQTSLCIQFLLGRPIRTGTLYYYDLLNLEFETIPMV